MKTDNSFADVIKGENDTTNTTTIPVLEELLKRGSKHVGSYFHPAVSKKIKQMAANEETTIHALVAEALSLLLQSRNETIILEDVE